MRTDEKLQLVCQALRTNYGDMHGAARYAGISPDFLLNWCRDDKVAAEAVKEAQRIGWMGLESVLIDRGVNGTQKQVWYKGEVVGFETEYHHNLLLKAIEARVPAYKKGESSGIGTVNGNVYVAQMPRASNYEEWVQMRTVEEQRVAGSLPAPKDLVIDADYTVVSGMQCLQGLL